MNDNCEETKELEVIIPDKDQMSFYRAFLKPIDGIVEILKDSPFEKSSKYIYDKLSLLYFAKNGTVIEQEKEREYITERIEIAQLLRWCKFSQYQNDIKIHVCKNLALPIPKEIKQLVVDKLEEMYIEFGLNKDYLTTDEAKTIVFDDAIVLDDGLEEFAKDVYGMSFHDMKLAIQAEDIIQDYIYYYGEVSKEITNEQVLSRISRLEKSLEYNSPKAGGQVSDIRIHCAVQVFLQTSTYKRMMRMGKEQRGFSKNHLYWLIFQCLDYMNYFPAEVKKAWGNRKQAQISYIKSMCTQYSKAYEMFYIEEDE